MIWRIKESVKVVLIFSISPGFVGAFYLLWGFYFAGGGEKNLYAYFYAQGVMLYGFVGGMILYGFPAFVLGLIYASLRMKKGWVSYVIVSIFSPLLVALFNGLPEYLIFARTTIDEKLFFTIICPAISVVSVVAAHISFRKQ